MGTHPVSTATTAGAGCGGSSLSCPPTKAGSLCPEGHKTPELTLPEEQNVPRAPGGFVTETSQDKDKLLPSLDMDTACGKPFTPPRQGAEEFPTFSG